MLLTAHFIEQFQAAIETYHITDHIDQPFNSGNREGLNALLYKKAWVDTVQWHLEDIIRDPQIDANYALQLKRRIDASNQTRTDLVEQLDDHLLEYLELPENIHLPIPLNTESIGWALDRLSILLLKIYHMRIEVDRNDATDEHINQCKIRLIILEEQLEDLSSAIDWLITEVKQGKRRVKVYRQVKMYNDPQLNPVLYKKK
jgi:hypothetical protein